MNIAETISFDKEGEPTQEPSLIRKLFLSLVIILTAALSFGVGRLTSAPAGQGIRIEYDGAISNSQFPISNGAATALGSIENSKPARPAGGLKIENSAAVVASKNGSKYHYPSCPGAKQIKEANKITFPSPQAAEAAGYTLAANCSSR